MSSSAGRRGAPASLRDRRFIVLLAALALLLVVPPLLRVIGWGAESGLLSGTLSLALILTLAASAFAASLKPRVLVGEAVVIALVLVLDLASRLFEAEGPLLARDALTVGFLCFVCAQVLKHVFTVTSVTADTVAAVLSLYLLLGVAWALVFSIVDTAQPGSFGCSWASADEVFRLRVSGGSSVEAFYFSLVTLTTLGYGDIVPLTPPARSLAVAEALMGQLFLAVLVARVVALQIAQGPAARGD